MSILIATEIVQGLFIKLALNVELFRFLCNKDYF